MDGKTIGVALIAVSVFSMMGLGYYVQNLALYQTDVQMPSNLENGTLSAINADAACTPDPGEDLVTMIDTSMTDTLSIRGLDTDVRLCYETGSSFYQARTSFDGSEIDKNGSITIEFDQQYSQQTITAEVSNFRFWLDQYL